MASAFNNDRQFPLLEVLLGLSVLALVLQLLPGGWYDSLDFRTWRGSTWMIINTIVISALLASRYGPELVASRSERSISKSPLGASRSKQMHKDRKERTEAIRRARASRKRRLYP